MSSTTQRPSKEEREPGLPGTCTPGEATPTTHLGVASLAGISIPTSRPASSSRPGSGSSSGSSSSSSTSTSSCSCSSSSTATPTRAKATSTHPKYACFASQLCPKTGQAIDVLSRHYPKPEEAVDVEQALGRGPLPGRYWMVPEQAVEDEGKRRQEFERVKKELRGW